MSETTELGVPRELPTRRKAIFAAAMTVGALVVGGTSVRAAQETMKKVAGTPGSEKLTALHQEIPIKAAPQRIYEALLDSKKFAAFSGAPAEIDAKEGGAFAMFGWADPGTKRGTRGQSANRSSLAAHALGRRLLLYRQNFN